MSNSADPQRAAVVKTRDTKWPNLYPDNVDEIHRLGWSLETLLDYHGSAPLVNHSARTLVAGVLQEDLTPAAWRAAVLTAINWMGEQSKTGAAQLTRDANAQAGHEFLRAYRVEITAALTLDDYRQLFMAV